MLRNALGVFLCFILLSGCSERPNGFSSDPQNAAKRLELEELFRIGDETSGDTLVFGRFTDFQVNSANQLLLADHTASKVYVFSETGTLVSSFGRQGEGPGEFLHLANLHVGPNDSVFVWDWRNQSISVFEPETYEFAYTLSISGHEATGFSIQSLISMVDDIFLMRISPYYSPGMDTKDHLSYDRIHHVSRQGNIIGEPILELPRSIPLGIAETNSYIEYNLPFSRFSYIQAGTDGNLYSGWNDSIHVAVHTMDGTLVTRIRHPHQAISVTQEELNYHISDLPASHKSMYLDAIPKTKPAYSAFMVDDLNRIWVRRILETEAATARWTGLSLDHDLIYEIVLPAGVQLRRIKENRAYGVVRDEHGASYAAVYAIQ